MAETNNCGLPLCLVILLVGNAATFIMNDEYEVYLTTGDQSKKLSHEQPIRVTSSSNGYSVWVDRTKRRQTIEGFGAAITNSAAYVIFNSPKRHEIMQDLFGENGLHVTYIRLTLGCSDFQAVNPYTYDDIASEKTDFDLNHFSINKDKDFIIPILKEALSINPSLKIMGTPWTAPAWMKTSHVLFGGDMQSDGRYLHTLALYFVKVIQAYQAEGIHIDSLTVQNEPLFSTDAYCTMTMPADTQTTLIRDHLGPMFRQNGISTKVLLYDHNWSGAWYPEQILNDANVRQYVSGVAWHGYEGRHDAPLDFHNKHPDIGMYFSEITGGTWDTNWASVLVYLTRLITIGQTRSFAKAVLLWNIALDENNGPKVNVGGCYSCRGVVTVRSHYRDYVKNVEYYALGHMSKFVKPGAVRLESASFDWDDLHTAAFQNPDGTTVIVVLNPNGSKSASFSLDIDAKHYHYDNLPPNSVVTFVK